MLFLADHMIAAKDGDKQDKKVKADGGWYNVERNGGNQSLGSTVTSDIAMYANRYCVQ